MGFMSKVKWILGILMIFVLIIATNLIDRNNFLRVKDAVETIYEDRVVANDIIFEINSLVHDKELALVKQDSLYFIEKNEVKVKKMLSLLSRFEKTRLTKEEKLLFANLKEHITQMNAYKQPFGTNESEALQTKINEVKDDLHDLTKIQLSEGGRQLNISKKAINSVELFTQLEIYILIGLAILIQIVVIYDPKKTE